MSLVSPAATANFDIKPLLRRAQWQWGFLFWISIIKALSISRTDINKKTQHISGSGVRCFVLSPQYLLTTLLSPLGPQTAGAYQARGNNIPIFWPVWNRKNCERIFTLWVKGRKLRTYGSQVDCWQFRYVKDFIDRYCNLAWSVTFVFLSLIDKWCITV